MLVLFILFSVLAYLVFRFPHRYWTMFKISSKFLEGSFTVVRWRYTRGHCLHKLKIGLMLKRHSREHHMKASYLQITKYRFAVIMYRCSLLFNSILSLFTIRRHLILAKRSRKVYLLAEAIRGASCKILVAADCLLVLSNR